MNSDFVREIFYYENYYLDFFNSLNPEVKKKFNWTLQLISTLERIPEKYFKHLTDSSGIYEIRVEVGSNCYRVFSFFDKGKLIILLNGFHKKSTKTPLMELELAEKLKIRYFNEQKNRK
ncbi:type II toxin-antitoxin system RelE/ParE family toxin [Sphingobacterium hungaricum]